MKITSLTANWFAWTDAHEAGEEYADYTVGKKGVVGITEHRPTDPNDKWYYDIGFDDGAIIRVFNPNTVKFEGEPK